MADITPGVLLRPLPWLVPVSIPLSSTVRKTTSKESAALRLDVMGNPLLTEDVQATAAFLEMEDVKRSVLQNPVQV